VKNRPSKKKYFCAPPISALKNRAFLGFRSPKRPRGNLSIATMSLSIAPVYLSKNIFERQTAQGERWPTCSKTKITFPKTTKPPIKDEKTRRKQKQSLLLLLHRRVSFNQAGLSLNRHHSSSQKFAPSFKNHHGRPLRLLTRSLFYPDRRGKRSLLHGQK
jgi:hypothetical protein